MAPCVALREGANGACATRLGAQPEHPARRRVVPYRRAMRALWALALLALLAPCSCGGGEAAAAAAAAAPPTGPPKLEWEGLGFLSDHHVGSAPTAHFGIRIRNAGGGELQASFFVTSPSARFFVPRPRDLVLQPGQERIVDIRAPLYLLDAESRFRENATATIQSNGGTAAFSLSPEDWPEPPRGLKVHQMTNGNHAWHATPADAGAKLRLGGAMCVVGLLVLWLVARAARAHAHASLRAERRARKPPDDSEAGLAAAMAAAAAAASEAGDAAGSDEDALAAVRALQAREARAAEKAAALEAWHAESAWRDSDTTERDADAAPAAGSAPGASLCVVCLVRPRDVVALPCRHVALCMSCARRLVASIGDDGAAGGACPLCRGRVENYLQLFLS